MIQPAQWLIRHCKALRSRTNQKRWMALDRVSYRHRMPQGTVWSLA